MIITQPEWLPGGQTNIGAALNNAATEWASGRLMSVTILAETIEGGFMFWGTEPEEMLKLIGVLSALGNYLSHSVPFDGESDEQEGDGD